MLLILYYMKTRRNKKLIRKVFLILLTCILTPFVFSQNIENDGNSYVMIEIPAETDDNLFGPINFHVRNEITETCHINSGTILIGETKIKNGITYVDAELDGKIIYTKTIDERFKTAEGLSIKSPLKEFFKVYGQNIKFEVGTCMYLDLSDGWRACLSDDYTLDFSGRILFFYKIDEDYSWHMDLIEYLDFMQTNRPDLNAFSHSYPYKLKFYDNIMRKLFYEWE